MSLLLLLVGTIGAVVLGLISYDRNVSIQDQARVLNIGQLQQTISDMPYDLNIVTIQHFNGSTDDFTRQYSVNDIAIITIAIDVENRFLTISGGSEVPLSNNQYASAVSAFRSTIHRNNYTDATIAALLDIKHSLGISVFFIHAGRTIRLSVYRLVGQQRVNSLFSALGVILIIVLVGGFLLLILYNIIKGVLMLLWATFCLLTGRRPPAAFKKRNRGGDSESRDSYYREMYNHPVDTSSGSGGEASSHF